MSAQFHANADNVYQVRVGASDGKVTTTIALAVTVSNSKEGVDVRRIATGFVAPAAFSPVSATAMLVAEKTGAIYLLNPQTGSKSLLVQIDNLGSIGVTAIAASRTFANDGSFFVMYTTEQGFLLINRYVRNPAGPTVPDGFGPVLAVSAPQYGGGGWLGLDAGGTLLAATGDAGGRGDPTGSAQDSSSWLGKVIRIAPNPDPFAGATPSFFILSVIAKGLHQPNGGSVSQDNLLIADHGQDVAEEINLIPSGASLRNYGWPSKEGTRTISGNPPSGAIDPVIEYLRGTGSRSGDAIVGGVRGPSTVASLRDQYIFADRSGAIFAVNFASIREGVTLKSSVMERRDADFAPNHGAIEHPVAIATDGSGTPYILDADGDIFIVGGS